MTFIKGQRVRCVGDSFGLRIGKEYEVAEFSDGCVRIGSGWHWAHKFEPLPAPSPAEAQQPFKVGDTVRVASMKSPCGWPERLIGQMGTLVNYRPDGKPKPFWTVRLDASTSGHWDIMPEDLEPAPPARTEGEGKDSASSRSASPAGGIPSDGRSVDAQQGVGPEPGESGLPSGKPDPYALHREKLVEKLKRDDVGGTLFSSELALDEMTEMLQEHRDNTTHLVDGKLLPTPRQALLANLAAEQASQSRRAFPHPGRNFALSKKEHE